MAKGVKEKPKNSREKVFRNTQKRTFRPTQDKQKIDGRKRQADISPEVEAEAKARFVRISPRKVRLVIDLIRRENVIKAFEVLEHLSQRSSKIVSKLLKSAVANAKQKEKIEDKDLYISRIFANEGVRWKRIRPRAMGRADRYLKRTSHITVVVGNKQKSEAGNYGSKSKSYRNKNRNN